jgi:hypothetical protein
MNNLRNETNLDDAPLFLMGGDELSQLKGQTKAQKGTRLSKEGKKAIKMFRSNRGNKRNQV